MATTTPRVGFIGPSTVTPSTDMMVSALTSWLTQGLAFWSWDGPSAWDPGCCMGTWRLASERQLVGELYVLL